MTSPKAKLAGLALIAALCAGFTLGLPAPAWAGMDEGKAAYRQGDYATAIREWRPLAEQGNVEAQYQLGFMYENSQGVPQDYTKAVGWYRKAAEQGNGEVQSKAQVNLGLMYENGLGVPQDYAEAVKWFRKAAEQGYADAQSNLGMLYRYGSGVPQDYVLAHLWLNLAASRFSRGANRDLAFKNRDIVAKRMTPAQIFEAQKLAREWKPKK